jgi:FAD dependent oxidoreductase TIGR03364
MKYDLIIIGSGVMGSFHAYHALSLGKKVLLIDRNSHARQSSVRNFGQAVVSGLSLNKWHQLGRRSSEIYLDLQKKAGLPIRQNGSYYIANTPGEMAVVEELHSRFLALDYSCELWDKRTIEKELPAIKPEYALGALVFKQEVSVEPESMVQHLREFMVEQMGLEQAMNCLITDIQAFSDRVQVKSSSGRHFEAGMLLICNGMEFQNLYPELFANSDMEVSRLQMISLKNPGVQLPGNILTGLTIRRYESFKECDAWKNLDSHGLSNEYDNRGIHILFKQRPDGTVILGDSHDYLPASEAHNFSFMHNVHTDNLMIQEAKRIASFSRWEPEYTWSGYYSQCRNSDLFEANPEQGVHIITGIGGKGMTTSAGLAESKIKEFFN